MTVDITETLAPNSDQLDAIELAGGPRTFRIKEVTRGNAEQPVNVMFHDFPRAWRPSKGMRRVLALCWGSETDTWADRRVTLYLDPDVTFGKEKPGGTRISHLSHIDGPKKIPLLVARGRSAVFTVQPLKDAPRAANASTGPTLEQVAATSDVATLRAGLAQFPHLRDAIEARLAELGEA